MVGSMHPGPRISSAVNGLSERQRQCIALVGEGLTSKEIARRLHLSPSTVDNHIRAVVERLQAAGRIEAARIVQLVHSDGTHSRSDVVATKSLVDPIWRDSDASALSNPSRFPPLGGVVNEMPVLRRYWHVIQIALIGTMAFAAITATIAGIVGLFNQ